jgi:type VI secretion system lysozyme-like protein
MPGPILPSLLDRLTDEPGPPGCSQEEFARSVVRDLNDLVNTPRVDLSEVPERLTHVRTSILAYGLPRLGLLGKSKQDRERLAADLRDTIYRFEPRLASVVVLDAHGKDAGNDESSSRPYAFKIKAVLRSDPVPIEVQMGATLSRYPEAIQITATPPEVKPPEKDGDAR